MKLFLFFFFSFPFSFFCFAHELVLIKNISDSTSFSTNQTEREGLFVGQQALFSKGRKTLLAQVSILGSESVLWEVIEPSEKLFFVVGDSVTYSPSSATDEPLLQVSAQAQNSKELSKTPPILLSSSFAKHALGLAAFFLFRFDESSNIPLQHTSRSGQEVDLTYDYFLFENLSFGTALRFQKENMQTDLKDYSMKKIGMTFNTTFYLSAIASFYNLRPYAGINLGYGKSSTETSQDEQSGNFTLLPGFKVGGLISLQKKIGFFTELGLDFLKAKEEDSTGFHQTFKMTNLKAGIGIKIFF